MRWQGCSESVCGCAICFVVLVWGRAKIVEGELLVGLSVAAGLSGKVRRRSLVEGRRARWKCVGTSTVCRDWII